MDVRVAAAFRAGRRGGQGGGVSSVEAPVSTGFVCRCLARLDAALTTAGFEGALKDALRAAGVLGLVP